MLAVAHSPLQKSSGLTRAVIRLKRAARQRPGIIRLQTIVGVLGQDGLLTLNALLCILNIMLSPLQAVSLPLGFIQMMILIALLQGRRTMWLPRRWKLYPLNSARLVRLFDRWLPLLYRLEKVSHPRLAGLMRPKPVRLLTLWLALVLAFIVMLPIPLMNTTTSLAGLLLCLALINADGVLWIIGLAVTLAHGLLFVFWRALTPLVTELFETVM